MLGEGAFTAYIVAAAERGYELEVGIGFSDFIGNAIKIEYCPMCGRKLHDEEWHKAVEYWKKYDEEHDC